MPEWMMTMLGTATTVADETTSGAGNRRINEIRSFPDAFPENVLVRIDIGSTFYLTY